MNEKIYRLVSVAGAALMWGIWAYMINHGEMRIVSALGQGFLSGTITLLMIKSLKALQPIFESFLIGPFIVTITATTVGFFVHFLIGTSEIFATLAPAVAVGFIFSLITSYNLFLNSEREQA